MSKKSERIKQREAKALKITGLFTATTIIALSIYLHRALIMYPVLVIPLALGIAFLFFFAWWMWKEGIFENLFGDSHYVSLLPEITTTDGKKYYYQTIKLDPRCTEEPFFEVITTQGNIIQISTTLQEIKELEVLEWEEYDLYKEVGLSKYDEETHKRIASFRRQGMPFIKFSLESGEVFEGFTNFLKSTEFIGETKTDERIVPFSDIRSISW